MDLDVTSISAIVAAVGVIVGVVLTLQELRHLRNERHTDLLVRLAPWLNMSSSELQQAYIKVLNLEFEDYDDFVRKYGPPLAEKPEQMAMIAVGNYFEAVGTLLRRKLIDMELIWDYWGETFIMLWEEKYKYYVEGTRKQLHQPDLADTSEYLYDEMKKKQKLLETQ